MASSSPASSRSPPHRWGGRWRSRNQTWQARGLQGREFYSSIAVQTRSFPLSLRLPHSHLAPPLREPFLLTILPLLLFPLHPPGPFRSI
eukprot:768464-Hanusia_phi.AAC.2